MTGGVARMGKGLIAALARLSLLGSHTSHISLGPAQIREAEPQKSHAAQRRRGFSRKTELGIGTRHSSSECTSMDEMNAVNAQQHVRTATICAVAQNKPA